MASVNGNLNLSSLEGWWAEAYDRRMGWALRTPRDGNDTATEAAQLYRLLAREILPAFRHTENWGQRMARSIATCVPRFNSLRMLDAYRNRIYGPGILVQTSQKN